MARRQASRPRSPFPHFNFDKMNSVSLNGPFGLVALISLITASFGFGQDDKTNYPLPPKIAAASNEGELALTTFKVPAGWKSELWAAEPMLANPVVFSVDAQGRIWVCESYRQDAGVTDNRSHDDVWLDRDLAAQTVEDRIAYHKELLPREGIEYTRFDDLIRVLEDVDGDGKADKQEVFADHFNELEMGTGAGVLVNGKDVYYTCIPDLWLLRDNNQNGKSDFRQSLSRGYGVRVAFRGHDSHGLIIGPDGRLYFSIGDRGYSIQTREGRRLHDPASGAVFRCELDGSNLEVIATGLRNPQELAFDDYGNLFTGDNNSDSGDQARWVYIAEGGDSGWRMHYQYMPDRGPFNREKVWHPYHQEQPAFIVPPITNISDGPSGLAYYPGTGLSNEYKGRFFLCDFRGASAVSGIRTFRSEPRGAFFELVDDEKPIWQILATDIDFAPDGWIYVSDWVNGWAGEGKGRLYRFGDPKYLNSEVVREVKSILANGLVHTPMFRLTELMNHEDRRVRQMAQFEMVSRKLDEELEALVLSESPVLGRLHALWGIGQRIRSGENIALKKVVTNLLSDKVGEIRAHAAKLIGDLKIEMDLDDLVECLSDTELRVRYFAAISLGKFDCPSAKKPLLDLLETNNGEDPAIRHAAIMGLTGQRDVNARATPNVVAHDGGDLIEYARRCDSVEVRRAIAVVYRRQKSARIQELLEFETDPLVLDEIARAIYDTPIPPALGSLAAALNQNLKTESEHFLRRALGACNHLGGAENLERLAIFAADESAPKAMRQEAVEILAAWANPSSRDRVMGDWMPIGTRSRTEAIAVLEPVFEKLIGDDETRKQAISAAKSLRMNSAADGLQVLFADESVDSKTRMNVLLALSDLDAENLPDLAKKAAADSSPNLRMAAREVSVQKKFPQTNEPEFWNQGLESSNTSERQHVYRMMASDAARGNEAVRRILSKKLASLDDIEEVPDTDRLDLIDAAKAWDDKEFKRLISQYQSTFDQTDPTSRFRNSLVGGDAERGSEIFWNRTSVYCQRCHQIGSGGGAVGPNLSDIGLKKKREYLLESIVDPNKTIAENFETTVILDIDGRTLTGIVQKETEDYVQLIDAEAKVTTIQQDDIEERRKGQSAMPVDLLKNLSDQDVRDLVEFLAQQKTAPKKGVVIPEGNK